jgi:hypothetical protein
MQLFRIQETSMSTSFTPTTSPAPVSGATSKTIRKILLACGILAAVLMIGADILAAMLYPGYSYTGQAISELSAIGAPTKSLLAVTGTIFLVLEFAFAVGIWLVAGHRRSLRITAGLLFALWAVGVLAIFFPMQQRTDIATSGPMLTDVMHLIIWGVVTSPLILLMIGFGAAAGGKWFRVYSYATILLFAVGLIWTWWDAPAVGANLPTPWLGVHERLMVYAEIVWLMVLAIVLLQAERRES